MFKSFYKCVKEVYIFISLEKCVKIDKVAQNLGWEATKIIILDFYKYLLCI